MRFIHKESRCNLWRPRKSFYFGFFISSVGVVHCADTLDGQTYFQRDWSGVSLPTRLGWSGADSAQGAHSQRQPGALSAVQPGTGLCRGGAALAKAPVSASLLPAQTQTSTALERVSVPIRIACHKSGGSAGQFICVDSAARRGRQFAYSLDAIGLCTVKVVNGARNKVIPTRVCMETRQKEYI